MTPPRTIYAPKPEYPEEARKEKIEGVCVLYVVVGPDGLPRDIRVTQTLGAELDDKATEAVKKWRFEPATKDGKPVAVAVMVEVEFRLESDNVAIRELQRRADAGDAKALLELSTDYFRGKGVTRSESLGCRLLKQAAEGGLREAQHKMGEYSSGKSGKNCKTIGQPMVLVTVNK